MIPLPPNRRKVFRLGETAELVVVRDEGGYRERTVYTGTVIEIRYDPVEAVPMMNILCPDGTVVTCASWAFNKVRGNGS